MGKKNRASPIREIQLVTNIAEKYEFAVNITGMQMRTSDDDDLHTLKERQEMSNANISQGRSCPEVDPYIHL